MYPFSEEEYDYSHIPAVASEEAQRRRDQIEDREAPLSRFGAPNGDDYGKEKGD